MWRRLAVSIGLSLILLGLVAAVRTGVLADTHVMPGKAQGGPLTNAAAFQQGADARAAAPELATQTECEVVRTFQPEADTYISAENPNTNFGDDEEFVVGMKGRAGVLARFDVSDIPANWIVEEATLGLMVTNYGQRPDESIIVAAYPVSRTWEEMEATWTKATDLDDWGKAGCNDTTSDRSPTPLDHEEVWYHNRWYTWDVASAVQGWVQDPASNKGVYLLQVNTEVGGEYDARHLYLTVKYGPRPVMTVTKELTNPPSGVARVPDTMTFTVRITNTGPTTMTSLTVIDTYDSNFLTFTSWSEEPDEQAPGIITWTNSLNPFLPLAPGQDVVLTLDFHGEKATDTDVTTNTVTAWGVDECGRPVGPEEDNASVKIKPQYQLYIPKVIACQGQCQVMISCSQAGDPIYRIESGKEGFFPYTTRITGTSTITRADWFELNTVTSPPAPEGWNQPDPGFDVSSWVSGSIVWWPEDWDFWWKWMPKNPSDPISTTIGLKTDAGEDEGKSGTTHLYRRWFDVPPPPSDLTMACAVLEMWSDNKSNWWWGEEGSIEGELIRPDDPNGDQFWIREIDLFTDGLVESERGRYLLAIQTSNDYVCEGDTCNAHGTAFCLTVTWCDCPPEIARMGKSCPP